MSSWEILRTFAQILDWAVIGMLSIQLGFVLLILVHAAIAVRERPPYASAALLWRRYADVCPPLTIIAPAYNEALTIAQSVEALLAL